MPTSSWKARNRERTASPLQFGRNECASFAHTLIRGPTFREPSWVRGVAWSILGGSGPLDSGSNPDGPTTGLNLARRYRFGYVNTRAQAYVAPAARSTFLREPASW